MAGKKGSSLLFDSRYGYSWATLHVSAIDLSIIVKPSIHSLGQLPFDGQIFGEEGGGEVELKYIQSTSSSHSTSTASHVRSHVVSQPLHYNHYPLCE